MQARHGWFWLYLWLVEKLVWAFLTKLSESEIKQNQSNHKITFDTQLKTALMIIMIVMIIMMIINYDNNVNNILSHRSDTGSHPTDHPLLTVNSDAPTLSLTLCLWDQNSHTLKLLCSDMCISTWHGNDNSNFDTIWQIVLIITLSSRPCCGHIVDRVSPIPTPPSIGCDESKQGMQFEINFRFGKTILKIL